MENSEFVSKVQKLLQEHGEELSHDKYSTDFDSYADYAQEADSQVNLRRAHVLGRAAVHTVDLQYITVCTSLSMLGEAAGVMPAEPFGQLLGSFDAMAFEATKGSALLTLRSDIYTSGRAVWLDTYLNINGIAGSAAEQETLAFFRPFNRQIFNESRRSGGIEDELSPQDLDAVSTYLDQTIGTLPFSHRQ